MAKKVRESLFNRLKESLEEARQFTTGELTLKTFTAPDPPPNYNAARSARIRKSLYMSQSVFARVLNISLKTVQSWDQRRKLSTQDNLVGYLYRRYELCRYETSQHRRSFCL